MELPDLYYFDLELLFFDFFSEYDPTNKENLFKLIVKGTKKKFFFRFCVFDHHHREDSITNFIFDTTWLFLIKVSKVNIKQI